MVRGGRWLRQPVGGGSHRRQDFERLGSGRTTITVTAAVTIAAAFSPPRRRAAGLRIAGGISRAARGVAPPDGDAGASTRSGRGCALGSRRPWLPGHLVQNYGDGGDQHSKANARDDQPPRIMAYPG